MGGDTEERKLRCGSNNGALVKWTTINARVQNRGSRFNALNEDSSVVMENNDDNGNTWTKKENILN